MKKSIARKNIIADDITHTARGVPRGMDSPEVYSAKRKPLVIPNGFKNFEVWNVHPAEYAEIFLAENIALFLFPAINLRSALKKHAAAAHMVKIPVRQLNAFADKSVIF